MHIYIEMQDIISASLLSIVLFLTMALLYTLNHSLSIGFLMINCSNITLYFAGFFYTSYKLGIKC